MTLITQISGYNVSEIFLSVLVLQRNVEFSIDCNKCKKEPVMFHMR